MSGQRILLKKIAGGGMVRVLSLALTFFSSVLLARLLGVEDFGVYSYVLALISLLSIVPQAGIPTLLVRETAGKKIANDWGGIKGVWVWCNRYTIKASISCALLLMVLDLFGFFSGESRTVLLIGLPLIPLVSLSVARSAALRGLNFVIIGQLPESILKPLIMIVVAGLCWCVLDVLTAGMAMVLNVVVCGISFFVGLMLLKKLAPREVRNVEPENDESKRWKAALLPLAILGGAHTISSQTGIVLVGYYEGDVQTAHYKIAVSVAMLGASALQITNMVLSPYVVSAYSAQDENKLYNLTRLGSLTGLAFMLPVFGFFYLFGEGVLSVFYGEDFKGGYSSLVILLFGQLLNSFFGSTSLIMNMTGNEKQALKWILCSSLLVLMLTIFLVPLYGATGAAYASVAGLLFWNAAFWLYIKAKIGVDSSILSWFLPRK